MGHWTICLFLTNTEQLLEMWLEIWNHDIIFVFKYFLHVTQISDFDEEKYIFSEWMEEAHQSWLTLG